MDRDPSDRGVARAAADATEPAALAGRLRRDVDELTRRGDRRPGAPGHDAARDYLARRLAALALLDYTGDGFVAPFAPGLANVLAVVPGADRHCRPVVLATSYDASPGSPGASRNAAAVAVILAVVPRLLASSLERGVVVALLDGVAPPRRPDASTGAGALLSAQRRHDFKAGIVLDRLGHPGDGIVPDGTLLVTGAESDARMPRLLANVSGGGVRLVPVHRRYRPRARLAAPFHEAALPHLELCGGAWSGHGTDRDAPDRLDYDVLARVVQVVETLVRALDGVRLPGPYEGYDSSTFEAEALERSLGASVSPSGRWSDAAARRRGIDDAVASIGELIAG